MGLFSKLQPTIYKGDCQVCGFAGILQQKHFIDPTTMDAERAPKLWLCVTCFETPTGIISENVKHQRLSEEEYKKK